MKKLFLLFLLVSLPALAAVPVTLAPIPQFFALDSSGRPLGFGCVFAFQSGTTTPIATYTDASGVTQNTNPVILNAAGSANMWLLSGQAYTLRVKGFGGSNCANGPTRYTVNGIGGGSSQIVSNVAASTTPQFTAIAQNQLFTFTLTSNAVSLPLVVNNIQAPAFISFQISQNASGGFTFTWPVNVIGGGVVYGPAGSVNTQTFIWNGSTATAIGPLIAGQEAAGQITTTLDVHGPSVLLGGLYTPILTFDNYTHTAGSIQGNGTVIATTVGGFVESDGVCFNSSGSIIDCGFQAAKVYDCGASSSCSNTLATSPQIVFGSVGLSGGTATVSGISPGFPTNYQCVGTDATAANAVKILVASPTSFTVTGTGSDVISYQCVGR